MTRILFCTSGYFPDLSGGAEHQARLQAQELTRRGHVVNVVCPKRRAVNLREVDGIRVYRIPVIERPYFNELSYCLLLAFFLLWNLRRFQLVHIHMTHLDSVVICVLARIFGRPVYAKIARGGRGGDALYLNRSWYLRRFALSYPARFQVISEQIGNDLRALGVASERLVAIPNGVEINDLPTERERRELRERLGVPSEATLVLFLGRFVPMKGLDVLLKAWASVLETSAVLVLVGRRPWDGHPSLPLGEGPLARHGAVVDFNWSNEPGEWTRACDVFVLPSRGEGMSNALLRAMADGLAVVATRVGAAESMIEDGVSGRLLEVDDTPTLATALQELIADPAARRALGAAARARVAREYSIESVVDRIEAQYSKLLGGTR